MQLHHLPASIVTDQKQRSEAHTQLRGGFLALARGIWIAGVVATVWLFVTELPKLYTQIQTVRVRVTVCPTGTLSPTGVRTLHDLGLSVGEYAAYIFAFFVTLVFVWSAVGFVIFWRRSDDWMALLVSLFLVMFMTVSGIGKSSPAFVSPAWGPPFQFVSFLAVVLFGCFFYLFPDGRFVPRWTRWCAMVGVVLAVPLFFFPNSPFDVNAWPGGLNVLTILSFGGTLLFAQLYRYRRISNQVQRQQTKWVVFGVTIALVVFLGGELICPDLPIAQSTWLSLFSCLYYCLRPGLAGHSALHRHRDFTLPTLGCRCPYQSHVSLQRTDGDARIGLRGPRRDPAISLAWAHWREPVCPCRFNARDCGPDPAIAEAHSEGH